MCPAGEMGRVWKGSEHVGIATTLLERERACGDGHHVTGMAIASCRLCASSCLHMWSPHSCATLTTALQSQALAYSYIPRTALGDWVNEVEPRWTDMPQV